MSMRAMILAAGRGKRMRPLTDLTPKPLLKIADRPLIEWHLTRLARAGFRHVVVNNAWLGDQIESYLGDGSRWNLCIEHSRETEALETAGGIARALPMLGEEPFLVINGDIWSDWNPALAYEHATRLRSSASCLGHLTLVNNPPQHLSGDFLLNQQGFVQDPDQNAPEAASPGTTFTFSGIGVYKAELFQDIPEDEPAALGPLLRKAMQLNQILGSLYTGQWHDVGTVDRLEQLDRTIKSQAPDH